MNPLPLHPFRYWRWQRGRRRSRGDWPTPSLPVVAAPLLAIDLEMTGLDPGRDEIVSIGWVPIDAGVIDLSGCREHYMARRDRKTVGHSATIHGLRDCDLASASPPREALLALIEALRGRVAVFHHAPLDLAFLRPALAKEAMHWAAPVIDTLAWHRRRMRLSGREDSMQDGAALAAAGRHYGLIARSQHDALADALSCAELLLALSARGRTTLIEVAAPPG